MSKEGKSKALKTVSMCFACDCRALVLAGLDVGVRRVLSWRQHGTETVAARLWQSTRLPSGAADRCLGGGAPSEPAWPPPG